MTHQTPPSVLIETTGDGIVVLTLNRPRNLNALTSELCQGIVQAIKQVNDDEHNKVIILTSAGKVFSAGGDIKTMQNHDDIFAGEAEHIAQNYRENIHQMQLAVYHSHIPIIAAVNGAAVGAGNDLVAICDMAIASKEHAKFQESFLNLGLISGAGGAWVLPRVVGRQNAFYMALTTDWVNANKAAEMGLVLKAVPHDDLMSEAMTIAKQIARHPSRALRTMRRLMIAGESSNFEASLEQCADVQSQLHMSAEHGQKLQELLERIAGKTKT